jgi:hypothetical protein
MRNLKRLGVAALAVSAVLAIGASSASATLVNPAGAIGIPGTNAGNITFTPTAGPPIVCPASNLVFDVPIPPVNGNGTPGNVWVRMLNETLTFPALCNAGGLPATVNVANPKCVALEFNWNNGNPILVRLVLLTPNCITITIGNPPNVCTLSLPTVAPVNVTGTYVNGTNTATFPAPNPKNIPFTTAPAGCMGYVSPMNLGGSYTFPGVVVGP